MKIAKTKKFIKQYQKLPQNIQKKTDKQIEFLSKNIRYPSLKTKKLEGFEDVWEGRVDRFYRFIFMVKVDTIIIFRIGPHPDFLKLV